ncbi:hypothetical protein TNCV_1006851 [Trichonephila clavipes]|nr:hypothetical protein TNCV_1006851 [Trichonephila clavipes]
MEAHSAFVPVLVRRRPGERLHLYCQRPRHTGPGEQFSMSGIRHLYDRMPERLHSNSWRDVTVTLNVTGQGSNPREDVDVCKCTVPSWHGSILNSRKFSREVGEGEERWEAPDLNTGCSPSKSGWNRAKSYMVLKATANDRRTSSPLP